jgi:hypothetical protein
MNRPQYREPGRGGTEELIGRGWRERRLAVTGSSRSPLRPARLSLREIGSSVHLCREGVESKGGSVGSGHGGREEEGIMGHGILAAGGRPPEQVACALVLDAGTELNLAIPFVQLGQVVGANSDCGGVVDKSTPVASGRRHAAVQRHQSMRLPRVIHHHQKGERERPGHLPVTRLLLLLRHVLVEPPATNLGCARRRRSGGASRDGTRLIAPWRSPCDALKLP